MKYSSIVLGVLGLSSAIALSNPQTARAEWVEVYRDRSVVAEVESSSFARHGGDVVSFVTRRRHTIPRRGFIKADVVAQVVDCGRLAYMNESALAFNIRGQAVASTGASPWRLIKAGSYQDAIANAVCQLSEP